MLTRYTTLRVSSPVEPKPDMCKCYECNYEFEVDTCIKDFGHHNGWELPPYTEILCPVCEDGGEINDFWFSEDVLSQIV